MVSQHRGLFGERLCGRSFFVVNLWRGMGRWVNE